MTNDMTAVKALKDNDGHWYLVPNEKASQFHSMLRDAEESEDYEGFEDTYGEFMTGGDLNLVQLFVNTPPDKSE